MRSLLVACVFASLVSLAIARPALAAAPASLPQPATDLPAPAPSTAGQTRTLVVAGGCFWCIEAVFEPLAGVSDVVSGYAGGTAETADYKKVAAGQTDHAEAVQITYDPSKITYGQLLRVFMTMHDPTTKDGQHPDYGRQYRSAIFVASDEERNVAEGYIKQLDEAKSFDKPIATSVEPLEKFYPAEQYHQDYVKRNPKDAYVVRWALPKIAKLKKSFPDLLRSSTK